MEVLMPALSVKKAIVRYATARAEHIESHFTADGVDARAKRDANRICGQVFRAADANMSALDIVAEAGVALDESNGAADEATHAE
jgi:hypothetical protein